MGFNFGNIFGKISAIGKIQGDAKRIAADLAQNRMDAEAAKAALAESAAAFASVKAHPAIQQALASDQTLQDAFAVIERDYSGLENFEADLERDSADFRALENDANTLLR